MSKFLKPRRGTKKVAEAQLIGDAVLKKGEFFIEVPSAGEGKGSTGSYGLKMGDGATNYSNLPYILAPGAVYDIDGTSSTYTLQGTGTSYDDNTTNLTTTRDRINTLVNSNGKSNSPLSTILGSFANAILSCAGGLSRTAKYIDDINANITNVSNTANNAAATANNLNNNMGNYQPFGNASSIYGTTDANNFRAGVTLVSNCANMPSNGWFLLISAGTGGTQTQVCFSLFDNIGYKRYCASGNWSDWTADNHKDEFYASNLVYGESANFNSINARGSITAGNTMDPMSNVGITATGNVNSRRFYSTATTLDLSGTSKPNCFIDSNGGFFKTANTSSRRFKEDIKLVEDNELNPRNILDIDVVQFKYKKDYVREEDCRYNKNLIGFIAEDVYNKYPIAADYETDEDGNVVVNAWNEQYMIPAIVKLLQDQEDRISNLERDLYELKEKLS